MEPAVESKPAPAGPGFGASRGWWVVLGVLAVWHALLTLGLFGPEAQAFEGLMDERPILAGRHALHLYHGYLGSQAFHDHRRTVAFDPAFSAGYPKTPWFDTGSKPAEFFLFLNNGRYHPAHYKNGLLWCWVLLPLAIALAAWGAGLNRSAATIAAFAAMLVCWSDCGRERLWAGDLDLILASTLGVLSLGLGLLYHRSPNLLVWAGLTITVWAVCFCQVLVLLALLPLALVYYFGSGWQHRLLWHLGLLTTVVLVVIGNWFWLDDALRLWWIRSEPQSATAATSSLALLDYLGHHRLLDQPMLLGLLIALFVAGTIGVVAMFIDGRAVAARLFAVGCSGFLVLGLLGAFWRPHVGIDLERFLFTALLMLSLPAGQFIVSGFDWMGKLTGTSLRGAAVTCALLATVIVGCHIPLGRFARHTLRIEPLPLGLAETTQSTVDLIRQQTTPDARILWEETPETDAWTPLLPVLTERAYIGGLGPDAAIEHVCCRLTDGQLAGRPVHEWTDLELADYCRRYNIGWIAVRSKAALARFKKWSLVSSKLDLPDGGKLLTLRRQHSYVLTGKGKLTELEHNRLTLTDLNPTEGTIVLSFHYHPGMTPSADRVRIEKEPQLYDGIAFVRLRLTGPMARVTLRWGEE